MTINDSDAQLVASHLAGDPAALAGIYDRFADSLHDTAAAMLNDRHDAADVMQDVFLIATEKMGQLRDPERLKPWLFAILRNEVYRRTKNRKRTVAHDFSSDDAMAAQGFDMSDDRTTGADVDAAEEVELADLVRGAARGLDERDQLVLELSVRQGLEGQDLADALGVSANQSYTLVHRMRERVEKSLGAFAVAKAGRKDCDDLDSILAKWDGEFTVLIRKRVARHIESCEACMVNRRKVAPLALFGAAPVLAAPPTLRDQILGAAQMQTAGAGTAGVHAARATPYAFTAQGGFPQIVNAGRRLAAWIAPTAAASLLLVAAGAGFWWIGQTDDTFQSAAVPTIAVEQATTTDVSTTVAPDPSSTVPSTTAEPTTSLAATSTTAAPTTTIAPTTTPPTTTPPTTVASTQPPATQAPVVTPTPTAPPSTAAPTPVTTPPVVTDPPPPPTTAPPPAPGQLVGSSASVDLGPGQGASSATFTLSNPGDLPVSWSMAGAASPFTVSPMSGVLEGQQSVAVTVGIDRVDLPEGDLAAAVTFAGDGGQSTPVALSASVEHDPVIGSVDGPLTACQTIFVGSAITTVFQSEIFAQITDESPFTATLSMTGPAGLSGSTVLTGATTMFGMIDINPALGAAGTWNWSLVATDNRGNSASRTGTQTVTC